MKKPENLSDNEQISLLCQAVSREIVQEIMNYGVTQQQILAIINLLALELEDNNLMRSIIDLCQSNKTEKLHV